MSGSAILSQLEDITSAVQEEFVRERRILSYQEYLDLFAEEPARYARDAVQYVKDVFDHFGKEEQQLAWGPQARFKLFDLPWLSEEDAQRQRLIGQEELQSQLYGILENFVREGRANRLPLLHGPNGSSKTTVARCLMLALEHYSRLDEGALYRFHWVFPTRQSSKGSLGFSQTGGSSADRGSHACLPEEEVDARLFDELRDHPLFLLPVAARREVLEKAFSAKKQLLRPNQWLWEGELSQKNRNVLEALLTSHQGDLQEVLRHVLVERYFISRRYRTGAVTLGPELSVDARERQITGDRSLSALPTSLQAVTLFEGHGELLEASGGVLEFSDLLKRPLDAFKYLQITAETGEFSLTSQNVRLNCVMLGSANELELEAFRKHPEFESFRGRLSLLRTGYLLDWHQEQRIYDCQIASQLSCHVAPHATTVAAMFAVLTRLRRPDPGDFDRESRELIRGLSVEDKLELYADGKAPARVGSEGGKQLRSLISDIFQEGGRAAEYEGSFGISAREMRTVLLDASQNEDFHGLSPIAVLDGLAALCRRTAEFSWLRLESEDGGYHDYREFLTLLMTRTLALIESDVRAASGLVDEGQYAELFGRYLHHVNAWVKKEKVRSSVTGGDEDPDESLMKEVEHLLKIQEEPETARPTWINRIAAWAIEHPDEAVDNGLIFRAEIDQVRDSVFEERRERLLSLSQDVLVHLRDEDSPLTEAQREQCEQVVERLVKEHGYERGSAADAIAHLLKRTSKAKAKQGESS